jgi:hypothetical protein
MNNESKLNANANPNLDAPGSTLDRILSTDDQLVPSSGFVSAVMERVREESVAPPPIPFPWKRMLPGFALAAGVFGWGAFELFRYAPHALKQLSFAAPHLSGAATRDLTQAGWVALACVVSLLSWLFATRFTQRSRIF